ncbi:MAG: hydrogenase formation protein HypD [Kiritimatiellae bacterium]|nr:hydrogenase formation protein HypD [Kiritimatiellia bacterium]
MPIHHLEAIQKLAERMGRPVRLMEVCGTHTMTAFRSGLRSLLPKNVALLSGPGCPVCVTPDDFVDRAIAIARRPDAMITTFGDLLRVPGTESSLERERARGADIRVVYSALDALALAAKHPDRKVVFLGVGFETTAPTVAWSIRKAAKDGVGNFLVLSAHRTMPPAMAALLRGGEVAIDGFMCPGHVSAIIGTRPYAFICRDYSLPCVVAGFEADDMLAAIEMLLKQLAEGRAQVENQYTRGVSADGNVEAQAILAEVFESCDAEWRGLGMIPLSGLGIRDAYREHDSQAVLAPKACARPAKRPACLCGDVLRGAKLPTACTLFRTACTPETPVGACMVSSEGACAAYYRYGRMGGR